MANTTKNVTVSKPSVKAVVKKPQVKTVKTSKPVAKPSGKPEMPTPNTGKKKKWWLWLIIAIVIIVAAVIIGIYFGYR